MLRRRMFEYKRPLKDLKALHLDIIWIAMTSDAFCRLKGDNPYSYTLFGIIRFLLVNGTWFSQAMNIPAGYNDNLPAIPLVQHHKRRDTEIGSSLGSRCSRNSCARQWTWILICGF